MSACRKCGCPVSDTNAVPLWDGHVYCPACVEAACPGLADYAREHDTLEEVVPTGARRRPRVPVWLGYLQLAALPVLLLAVGPQTPGVLLACLYGWAIGLAVVTIAALVLTRWGGGVRRVVRAKGGVLELVLGDRVERFPLDRCWWADGQSRTDLTLARLDPRPAALVWVAPSRAVACGLTDEDYDLWAGFFEVAGVAEQRKVLGPFAGWKFTTGLTVGGVVSAAVPVGVLAGLERLEVVPVTPLNDLVVPVLYAAAIGGPGFAALFALGAFARWNPGWKPRLVSMTVVMAWVVAVPRLLSVPGALAWGPFLVTAAAVTVGFGLIAGFAAWWEWQWPHPEPRPGPSRTGSRYWPGYDDDE